MPCAYSALLQRGRACCFGGLHGLSTRVAHQQLSCRSNIPKGLAAAEHLITTHSTHSQLPPIVTLMPPNAPFPAAQQAPEEDFYQLLGVPRDAPPDLIKKQYYILARRYCNFDFS